MAIGTSSAILDRVETTGTLPSRTRRLVISWTSGTSPDYAGLVPDYEITDSMSMVLSGMKAALGLTIPGEVTPTDGYSIIIEDENGIDIFGGALESRSSSDPEQVTPDLIGSGTSRIIDGKFTFKLIDNLAEGASGTCKLYFIY